MNSLILLIVLIVSLAFINVPPNEAGSIIPLQATNSCIPAYHDYGCHKGYCWSTCTAVGLGVMVEWCYTTKSDTTFDFSYVPCEKNGLKTQCDPCWRCAGPCSIFRKDLIFDGDLNQKP